MERRHSSGAALSFHNTRVYVDKSAAQHPDRRRGQFQLQVNFKWMLTIMLAHSVAETLVISMLPQRSLFTVLHVLKPDI